MIKCENLSFSYDGNHRIIDDVSFKLQRGSFYFIRGASGAGKSTLLSILSLNMLPDYGHLYMFGKDVFSLPSKKMPFFRRKIGLVYQDFRLLDHLSVKDNIALPMKVIGENKKQIEDKVNQLLKWIGLYEQRDLSPKFLSGGGKQRVAIARAVVCKPSLLLADEPTGNLDPSLKMKIMNLFGAMNDGGTTTLIATHDTQLISSFNYPILRLENGKLFLDK